MHVFEVPPSMLPCRMPSAIVVQAREAEAALAARDKGGADKAEEEDAKPPSKIPTGLAALLLALQADSPEQEEGDDAEMATADA